ncbi:hypothetical protein KSP40_PGU000605 [Platanthera guangdongensis]|uniref:Uncharacterized protein n=1 Tax=Platanthera guangdongensis TaxID=2320717 RepID=A0ABR2MBU9_9ASPA
MEGVVGDSSTSNVSANLGVPNPSRYPPAASSLEEIQCPSFSSIRGGVFPEWCTASSLLRNRKTSRRNLRGRINLSLQHDVSSSQPHFVGGSNRLSTEHFPGGPSSVLNQPHLLPVSVLPHHPHHYPSSSKVQPSAEKNETNCCSRGNKQ